MASAQELKDRALAFRERRLYPEAAEAAHLYLQQSPGDMGMLLFLADASLMAGYVDEAEKILLAMHASQPNGYTWTTLAKVASARGDLEKSESLTREALKVAPDYSAAWQEFSAVHKFKQGDPMIAKAQRILKTKGIAPNLEKAVCYMLCKAMNDIKKWDRAWDYAARGGAVNRVAYDPDPVSSKLAHQRETFSQEGLAKRVGRGHHTDAPIFVLGMPRSGTTLVEAILAATGQITPMGELTVIPQIAREAMLGYHAQTGEYNYFKWASVWPDESFGQAAEYYLADCQRRNEGTLPTRFVDKLPGNALHIGEIALMFPNAYIIRLVRDPLDTCVSCYLGHFGTGHFYSTRPDWLGHAAKVFYASSREMCQIVPNPVLNLSYEDLVSDPEPEIRRMLDFLGADWHPNCLTPGDVVGHKSLTRSKAQIRQPISPRSVGRWKRYKNRIAPLAEALGISEEDWRARLEEDAPRKAA